jgi:transposase
MAGAGQRRQNAAGKDPQMAYTNEFKDQACKLVMEQGYSQAKASKELGLCEQTLRYWLSKRGYHAQENRAAKLPESDDPKVLKLRIADLESKLRRAEMEKDILKKATAFFASHQP